MPILSKMNTLDMRNKSSLNNYHTTQGFLYINKSIYIFMLNGIFFLKIYENNREVNNCI